MLYRTFWQKLLACCDEREAKAVARLVYEELFGMTLADIFMGADNSMSAADGQRCAAVLSRLLQSEPVQYVLGRATFCERVFEVSPDVLIPRPETEQLCHICAEKARQAGKPMSVLDIGTGSGCIAITLALELPEADVSACDISEGALSVARRNARRLGARVNFFAADALSMTAATHGKYDMIVSNPPYICLKEKADMEKTVTEHEPETALYVPDDNPLLFYRAIARYSAESLNAGGWLMFEINPRFADDMCTMLRDFGFADVAVYDDQFGRKRMTGGRKQ